MLPLWILFLSFIFPNSIRFNRNIEKIYSQARIHTYTHTYIEASAYKCIVYRKLWLCTVVTVTFLRTKHNYILRLRVCFCSVQTIRFVYAVSKIEEEEELSVELDIGINHSINFGIINYFCFLLCFAFLNRPHSLKTEENQIT